MEDYLSDGSSIHSDVSLGSLLPDGSGEPVETNFAQRETIDFMDSRSNGEEERAKTTSKYTMKTELDEREEPESTMGGTVLFRGQPLLTCRHTEASASSSEQSRRDEDEDMATVEEDGFDKKNGGDAGKMSKERETPPVLTLERISKAELSETEDSEIADYASESAAQLTEADFEEHESALSRVCDQLLRDGESGDEDAEPHASEQIPSHELFSHMAKLASFEAYLMKDETDEGPDINPLEEQHRESSEAHSVKESQKHRGLQSPEPAREDKVSPKQLHANAKGSVEGQKKRGISVKPRRGALAINTTPLTIDVVNSSVRKTPGKRSEKFQTETSIPAGNNEVHAQNSTPSTSTPRSRLTEVATPRRAPLTETLTPKKLSTQSPSRNQLGIAERLHSQLGLIRDALPTAGSPETKPRNLRIEDLQSTPRNRSEISSRSEHVYSGSKRTYPQSFLSLSPARPRLRPRNGVKLVSARKRKLLVSWLNSIGLDFPVEDIFEDCRSGFLLCRLIEILEETTLKGVNRRGSSRPLAIANVEIALAYMLKKGARHSVMPPAVDIVDGKSGAVLNFLGEVVALLVIRRIKPYVGTIVEWIQEIAAAHGRTLSYDSLAPPYTIKSEDFHDGLILFAIAFSYRSEGVNILPSVIYSPPHKVQEEMDNLRHSLGFLSKLGCTIFLEPEDFNTGNAFLDEFLVIQLDFIFKALIDQTPSIPPNNVQYLNSTWTAQQASDDLERRKEEVLQMHGMRLELELKEEELKTLRDEMEEKDRIILSLQDQLRKVEHAASVILYHQEQVGSLRESVQAVRIELVKKSAEIQEREDALAEKDIELLQTTERIKDLEEVIQEHEQNIEKYKEDIERLDIENNDLNNEKASLLSTLSTTEMTTEELKKAVSKAEEAQKQLASKIEVAVQENKKDRSALSILQNDNQSLRHTISKLQTKLEEKALEIDQLRSELDKRPLPPPQPLKKGKSKTKL